MANTETKNRKLWQIKIKRTWSKINAKVGAVLVGVGIALLILICAVAVLSCAAYFQLATNKVTWLLCFKALNVGKLLCDGNITSQYISEHCEELKDILEFAINISVAVSGIALSIITAVSYVKKVAGIKRNSSFKKIEVFESGVEDIAIMKSFFKNADFITIFSQTFSWVTKDKEMEDILVLAANAKKLSLFTPDSESVKETLKEKGELSNRIHKTKTLLRFSYVERDNARYLLYRQEESEHTYVIVVHENIESKYLLKTISTLVRNISS